MTALVIDELTQTTIEGTGVFDVLMRANKAHLEQEFAKGRIKGSEYATVYLGSLEAVLRASLEFLLQKRRNDLEAQLLEKQIALVAQQTANALSENANIGKQGLLLDKQVLDVAQKTANAVTENTVLVAQECKLRAEYDVVMATKLRTDKETELLTWKTNTEKAQTAAIGVDDNSVIGKQKLLFAAQADGFVRDAEQKATKILVDTWNVRRTTDEATVADGINLLNDATIGRAMTKLLAGINA